MNTVLITGGASGIGLELARALLERGCGVHICGRDPHKLERVRQALPGLHTVQADLTRPEDLERLAGSLGRLDLLVNNAAVQYALDFVRGDTRDLLERTDLEWHTNFVAPLHLTAHCLPLLRRSGGAVLNLTSGLALDPKKAAPVYCASKAALRSLTRALRDQLEGADTGVRVFEAMLPIVDTPMTAGRAEGRKIGATQAAREILRGLDRGQREIRVGRVKLFVWLHRLLPSVSARLLRDG